MSKQYNSHCSPQLHNITKFLHIYEYVEKFNKGLDRIVEYSYSFKQVRQLWYPIVVPAGRLPSQYISFHQKSAPQA